MFRLNLIQTNRHTDFTSYSNYHYCFKLNNTTRSIKIAKSMNFVKSLIISEIEGHEQGFHFDIKMKKKTR